MHKFINAHFRSEYSILSSAISIDKAIKIAKENKEEYLVITELNNFFSLAEFSEKSLQNNIKPIFGIELELYHGDNPKKIFNLILIAKNYQALLYLMSLSSQKLSNKLISSSIIDFTNLLAIDHPRLGYKARYQSPIDISSIYYLDFDLDNPRSILISEKVAFDQKDLEILDIFEQIKDIPKEQRENYSFFLDVHPNEKLVAKTNELITKAYFPLPSNISDFKLAKYKNADNISSFSYLEKLIWTNFDKSYQNKFSNLEKAKARISFELSVIKKLNIADYFLIIWDLVAFAKKNSIVIGPGRGSAASSIICFILNITTINPLEHNLLFERFLNLERISMPDIDIDIQDNKRDKLIEYVFNKYGLDCCAFICTFQKLSAKSALKDVARIKHINFSEINEITKLIPNDFSLELAFAKIEKFKAKIKHSNEYQEIFDLALQIENFPRQTGLHAAGIIVSEDKLTNHIPIFKDQNNLSVSQFSNTYLEKWGMLKIDLLGLKTLTIIDSIVNNIKKHIDPNFDLNLINFSDQKTNRLLSEGQTTGIFQLESFGMMSVLKKAKVNKFLDLVDIISLYRPGPIKNIDLYVENKNNPNKVVRIDKIYDAIVAQSHGIIIYQEQIMQIAQNFSKMSFSEADLLRKAISKKDQQTLLSLKEKFISQSIDNNHDPKIVKQIFNQIEKFAQYGFPKAHAVSYATISYQMAFLKTRFPKYFYEAILAVLPPKDTLKKYIEEIKKFNMSVQGPTINISEQSAFFDSKLGLILPLTLIKGLGAVVSKKILDERNKNGKFSSFLNFIERAKLIGIGDSMIISLIKSNALREFGNIKELLENLDAALQYFQLISFTNKKTNEIEIVKDQIETPIFKNIEPDLNFEIECENEYLQMVLNVFPTLKYEGKIRLADLRESNEYVLPLFVLDIKEKLDKNKNKIAVVLLCDSSKSETMFIFEKQWAEVSDKLKIGQIAEFKIIKKTNPYKNMTNYYINSLRILHG